MSKAEKLADELVTFNVTELIELKKVLKDKYGLEETIPVAIIPTAPIEEEKEEQSTFDVQLNPKGLEETKIKMGVIRIVKELTGLPLQEAKILAESAPVKIKEKLSKEEAESIRDKFVTIGADIILV